MDGLEFALLPITVHAVLPLLRSVLRPTT